MKLSLKLILLTESARSKNMAKAFADLEKEQKKQTTPSKILPLVYGNLVKLKKLGYAAEDNKFRKEIDDDINRLFKLMKLLGITPPRISI